MDSFERLQKANSELDLHIEEQARGWREIIKRGRKPELFIDSEKRVRSEWKRLGGAERGGKLPEVEIGKELLYARKNSSWRKFVRDADNLEQRKKRMRMVLAAMEVLPLDCLEGNCWFQGPFYNEENQEYDWQELERIGAIPPDFLAEEL